MTREDADRGREPTEGAGSGPREERDTDARPDPELRWRRIRDPRRTDDLGRNGRVVGSHFHEGDDAWAVLAVTYDGEVSGQSESEHVE